MKSTFRRADDISKLIALILSGAWRREYPPLALSYEQLALVTPILMQTGAAALAWQRVRNSDLCNTPAGLQLREAYLLHAVQAVAHERDLVEVVQYFRAHGIDPILVKGWASARRYSDAGLRPYGDIDLCIRPDQYGKAMSLLHDNPVPHPRVDLHKGFEKFGNGSWDRLYSRSQCQKVEGISIRLLAPEDHLHLLSFHFLREGAWRALWLVDIAVLVEDLPANFDWNICLETHRKSKDWVGCALALAEILLQANLDRIVPRTLIARPPSWVLSSALSQWEKRSTYERHKFPIARVWRRPHHYLAGARYHWPSPIEATVVVKAPFNNAPRLPFQIAAVAVRSFDLLFRTIKQIW